MGQHELPGGIATRLAGLSVSLISHFLAIAALAAEEARALIQRSLISLILVLAITFSLFIAYIALILTVVALLAFYLHWGLVSALGAAALVHVIFACILFIILRLRKTSPLFEGTSAELRHDLETLHGYSGRGYSGRSSSKPSAPNSAP
jgi:uncharacterized membrane protein YqjE